MFMNRNPCSRKSVITDSVGCEKYRFFQIVLRNPSQKILKYSPNISGRNCLARLSMCALKAKQIHYSPSPVRTMAPRSAMYWPLRNVATLPPTRSCSIKKDCKDLNHRIKGLNRLSKLVNDKESCILTGCPSMMQSFFITRAQTPGQGC